MKPTADVNLTVRCPVCRQQLASVRVECKTSDTPKLKPHDTGVARGITHCVGLRCSVAVVES